MKLEQTHWFILFTGISTFCLVMEADITICFKFYSFKRMYNSNPSILSKGTTTIKLKKEHIFKKPPFLITYSILYFISNYLICGLMDNIFNVYSVFKFLHKFLLLLIGNVSQI